MKKYNREINVFNIGLVVNKDKRAEKIKSTNINILLNKIKLDKKNELKKRVIFISLLLMIICFIGIFSLV